MQHKKFYVALMTVGALLVIITGIWLASAQPVSAQCGSAASSCKNCHEVQAMDPVNNDGTNWHTTHAFGDFCYICHAGNNQSTVEQEAHTGLVNPLADIKASCQQCHVNDLQDRAEVYASILGISLDSLPAPEDGGTTPVATQVAVDTTESEPPITTVLDVDDPNLVDYVERYEEIVLGRRPVNWGNIILIAMIAMLLLGGGGFVLMNENLVKVSFGETKKVEGEYPAEAVDMLPAIARLKPNARKSLHNILDNPTKTEKILGLIDEVVSEKKNEE